MSSVGEIGLDSGEETSVLEEGMMFESADGWEFKTFKYVFYREGRVVVAMRTSEGHEMSEKVSVCETGMPYVKSSESNFEVAGRLIRWIPGMRRPFELGQNIVRLFFPVQNLGDMDESFYK